MGTFPPIIVSQLHCSQQGAHKGLVSLLYIYINIAPPGGEEGEARGAIYLLYDVKVCMYINIEDIYIYIQIYSFIGIYVWKEVNVVPYIYICIYLNTYSSIGYNMCIFIYICVCMCVR